MTIILYSTAIGRKSIEEFQRSTVLSVSHWINQ